MLVVLIKPKFFDSGYVHTHLAAAAKAGRNASKKATSLQHKEIPLICNFVIFLHVCYTDVFLKYLRMFQSYSIRFVTGRSKYSLYFAPKRPKLQTQK